ncbi:MAG: hypothetical protein ABI068_01745 [Ktedonobacterales bacterium]
MIVRIHADAQYQLDDGEEAEFERLDQEMERAIEQHDGAAFSTALNQLVAYVRKQGEPLPEGEMKPSDVIVPSEDMTLAEAHSIVGHDHA